MEEELVEGWTALHCTYRSLSRKGFYGPLLPVLVNVGAQDWVMVAVCCLKTDSGDSS